MDYITFSFPNRKAHSLIYNFSYILNILMIKCLFYYSILQFETKNIAVKKINICLLFKDIFQIIIFISFYYIEKKKSKLTKREITLVTEEKYDDKVVLTKQTLMNNPNENLQFKLQKKKMILLESY